MDPTKLFSDLYLAKFLDILAKSFRVYKFFYKSTFFAKVIFASIQIQSNQN